MDTSKTPHGLRVQLAAAVSLLALGCVNPGDPAHKAGADHDSKREPWRYSRAAGQPTGQPYHTSVLAPEDANASALELTIRPGRTLVPPHESLEFPVVVEVIARARGISRPPLDLSLVFDKSGSMKDEGKLAYTLQAARLLIENLSEQDTISIVAYDTTVTVLDEQQPAVEKLYLAHWLDEIEPGGYTNLSGGLLAGVAEVRRGRRPDAVGRVILLTDGLANRGVTDHDELRAIANAAREEGIIISTVGVGSDFDEELLYALADGGGGSYAYVPDAEDIPGVVAGSIDGLLPVFCQNVRLAVQLPDEVKLVDRLVADARESATPTPPSSPSEIATFRLGDFLPGERRTVVLHLKLPISPDPTHVLAVLRARIDYQLAGAAGQPMFEQQELLVQVADSRAKSEESIDMFAMDTAWLTDVFDLTYVALQSRDRKLIDQARRTISTYQKDLEALADRDESGTIREHAALLAHYGEELEHLTEEGNLHDHEGGDGAYEEIKKDLHYRRYLLLHHGEEHGEEESGHGGGH